MKLYSYWSSSCAWRVRIVLNLKGIAFDYAAVNIAAGVNEQEASAYRDVNRFQQVPTLEWQDGATTRRLTQSAAIVEYLEEAYPVPALMPREPLARARVREAVQIVNSGIQPLQSSWFQRQLGTLAGDAAVPGFVHDVIERGVRVLDANAEKYGGRFLVGDALSLADVYLIPQLYKARRAGVDLTKFARLTAIEHVLDALPAFAGARPERQPDAAQD